MSEMRRTRISASDAEAIVRGAAPAGRDDLAPLAASIGTFRAAAFTSPVRPSAELAMRLDLESDVSPLLEAGLPTQRPTHNLGRMHKMIAWFAALKTGMKVVLGVAVASVLGVVGIGAASAIDGIVSEEMPVPTLEPTLEPTDEPTDGSEDNSYDEDEYDSFGEWVSERAKDKAGTGREFGELISETAQNKSGDFSESEDEAADESEDEAEDESGDDSDAGTESGQGGKPENPGKSDH